MGTKGFEGNESAAAHYHCPNCDQEALFRPLGDGSKMRCRNCKTTVKTSDLRRPPDADVEEEEGVVGAKKYKALAEAAERSMKPIVGEVPKITPLQDKASVDATANCPSCGAESDYANIGGGMLRCKACKITIAEGDHRFHPQEKKDDVVPFSSAQTGGQSVEEGPVARAARLAKERANGKKAASAPAPDSKEGKIAALKAQAAKLLAAAEEMESPGDALARFGLTLLPAEGNTDVDGLIRIVAEMIVRHGEAAR